VYKWQVLSASFLPHLDVKSATFLKSRVGSGWLVRQTDDSVWTPSSHPSFPFAVLLNMSTSRAARSLLALPARSGVVSQALLRPTSQVLPYQSSLIRTFSTSRPIDADESTKRKGLLKSLLHGSESAKQDGMTANKSHSQRVGRGKYIHEIQRHVVRPEKVDEYIALLAEYYPKVAADQSIPCRLIGSWQVHIGDLETFCESSTLLPLSAGCSD
jgi:hypothetical protein